MNSMLYFESLLLRSAMKASSSAFPAVTKDPRLLSASIVAFVLASFLGVSGPNAASICAPTASPEAVSGSFSRSAV